MRLLVSKTTEKKYNEAFLKMKHTMTSRPRDIYDIIHAWEPRGDSQHRLKQETQPSLFIGKAIQFFTKKNVLKIHPRDQAENLFPRRWAQVH